MKKKTEIVTAPLEVASKRNAAALQVVQGPVFLMPPRPPFDEPGRSVVKYQIQPNLEILVTLADGESALLSEGDLVGMFKTITDARSHAAWGTRIQTALSAARQSAAKSKLSVGEELPKSKQPQRQKAQTKEAA